MKSDLNQVKKDLKAENEEIKNMKSKLYKVNQDLNVEKETTKRKDSELNKAKENLETIETKVKYYELKLTEANKDLKKQDEVLKKMDLALATKDIDVLSWLLFFVKFALEASLGALKFRANREQIKFLIPAIMIAFMALLLNGWKVVRSCKIKKVFANNKFSFV